MINFIRIIFALIILFLPGLVLSFILFKKIDWLERFFYAFLLTLITVAPITYALYLILDFKINSASLLIINSGIIIVELIILLVARVAGRRA